MTSAHPQPFRFNSEHGMAITLADMNVLTRAPWPNVTLLISSDARVAARLALRADPATARRFVTLDLTQREE